MSSVEERAHWQLVLEVPGSILAAGEETFDAIRVICRDGTSTVRVLQGQRKTSDRNFKTECIPPKILEILA